VREHVKGPEPDRWLAPEIEAAHVLVADGSAVEAARAAVGDLE
jgi:histidine ammonia-lyase